MATLVSFWSCFGDRIADLGLIDSKLSLYIKINVNQGQNKFEVHISKNVAKMAILWPKIGQRHFGARASHGHNLAIFHQILTNEHTKMTSSLRRIEWNKILSSISLFYILFFLAPFLLRGLTWAMLYVWTKNYPQVVGTCSGHHGQLISQNCVLIKIRAEPPPPLNRSVQPLCPLCEAENDTVPHLLAQCQMFWQLRVEYFDTHYTTVTDIVDRNNLKRIIGYVNRTNRLEF